MPSARKNLAGGAGKKTTPSPVRKPGKKKNPRAQIKKTQVWSKIAQARKPKSPKDMLEKIMNKKPGEGLKQPNKAMRIGKGRLSGQRKKGKGAQKGFYQT
jgi:hypothetical protein